MPVRVNLRCTQGAVAGEVIPVETELEVGREASEAGRLGGDPRLSRRHARVFIDESGRLLVEDLGSTNGTWVNDERLKETRPLVNGDRLRLGETTFSIEVVEEPALTALDTAVTPVSPTVSDTATPGPRLSVLAGPTEGQEIPVGRELLIGRGYDEPGGLGGDSKLSRRHARIALGPGGVFFLEDTGSTNGTRLNGVRLRRAHSLKDGDEIELGSTKLRARGLPLVSPADELDREHEAHQTFVPPPAAPAPRHPQAPVPGAHPPRGTPPPAPASPPGEMPPFPAGQLQGAAAGLFQPQGAAEARMSRRGLITAFVVVFAAAAAIGAAAVLTAAPLGTSGCAQGFICHKPPSAPALRALTSFRGSLGWRVEYDPQIATPTTASTARNILKLGRAAGAKNVELDLQAFPAGQITPQARAQKVLDDFASQLVGAGTAPSSDQIFSKPVLGLHPAVGTVIEGSLRTPQGPGSLVKVVVLSATSGGVTIVADLFYLVQQGQQQQTNPDAMLDAFGDLVLGTVRFPGDIGV